MSGHRRRSTRCWHRSVHQQVRVVPRFLRPSHSRWWSPPPTTFPIRTSATGYAGLQTTTAALRAAMHEANASVGPDVINFNIPGGGVQTIHLVNPLRPSADGGLTINGYTQRGAQTNTDPTVSNAVIAVEIEGNGSAIGDPASIDDSGSRRAAIESKVWRCSTCSTRSSSRARAPTTT